MPWLQSRRAPLTASWQVLSRHTTDPHPILPRTRFSGEYSYHPPQTAPPAPVVLAECEISAVSGQQVDWRGQPLCNSDPEAQLLWRTSLTPKCVVLQYESVCQPPYASSASQLGDGMCRADYDSVCRPHCEASLASQLGDDMCRAQSTPILGLFAAGLTRELLQRSLRVQRKRPGHNVFARNIVAVLRMQPGYYPWSTNPSL